MKVLTTGHKYLLANFENQKNPAQQLQFIEKVPSDEEPTVLLTVNDGTTNEEVLAVLIDRLKYLQAKFPCRENALAITKIQEALFWLNERTRDRQARVVEGKHIA